MSNTIAMGVDIGGSHITASLVDLGSRTIIPGSFVRKAVNPNGSADAIITTWASLMKSAFEKAGVKQLRIGIGMPGPFDYETGISFIENQDKFDALYGLNVKQLLAEKLRIKPADIKLMNDAACFLQGEAFCGAARGYQNVLGLTLGTGLGSSMLNDDIAFDADLWNSPFKDSIAEDHISTRWFLRRYKQLGGTKTCDVKQLSEAYTTDEFAAQLFDEFGSNLASFINNTLRSFKINTVLLGGNIAKAYPLFRNALTGNLNDPQIYIVQAKLGEQASLLGASSLWYEEKVQKTTKGALININEVAAFR